MLWAASQSSLWRAVHHFYRMEDSVACQTRLGACCGPTVAFSTTRVFAHADDKNIVWPQVHWFSILNSCMVVVVMSCIVAMIMMRTIRKDLAQYESLIVDPGARPS